MKIIIFIYMTIFFVNINCSWYSRTNNKANNNEKTALLALITPQSSNPVSGYSTKCGVPSSPLNMLIFQFLLPHPYLQTAGAQIGFEPWNHNDCKPSKAFLPDSKSVGGIDVKEKSVTQVFTYNSADLVTEIKTTGKKEIAANAIATDLCPANTTSSTLTLDVTQIETYTYDSKNRITEISKLQTTCGEQVAKIAGANLTNSVLPFIGKYIFSYDDSGRVTQISIYTLVGSPSTNFTMSTNPYQKIDITYNNSEVNLKKSFFVVNQTTAAIIDTVASELNYTIQVNGTTLTGISGVLSCKKVEEIPGVELTAILGICGTQTATEQVAQENPLDTDILLDNDNKLIGYKEIISPPKIGGGAIASLKSFHTPESKATAPTSAYFSYFASYDIWGRVTSMNTVNVEYDKGTVIKFGSILYSTK